METSQAEQNKVVARRFFEEVWNQGRLEAIDELTAPGAITHDYGNPRPPRGLESMKARAGVYRTAFPDTHFTVEDQISEGTEVLSRWTCRATHHGPFLGIPPTGKRIVVAGMTIDRIVDGRIVESWINWDTLGLLQQLGILPQQEQLRLLRPLLRLAFALRRLLHRS